MSRSPVPAALTNEAINILRAGDKLRGRSAGFQTLGGWSVRAALSSGLHSIERVVTDAASSATPERQGRVSNDGSLEVQKRQGYV